MWCAILGALVSPLLCQSLEFLPNTRPPYKELFVMYGPNPDCENRENHVRYLTKLKQYPVPPGEDQLESDHAIDQYISRIRYYCQ